MPTIRFENDSDARVADHRKNFLESLELDPALWGEEQALKLSPTTRPRIFDMEMPVPACLLESEHWVARFERFDGFICFIVGDHTWAASVAGAKDLQSALKELPADLSCLKLANRQTLQDLSPLSGLGRLIGLDLRNSGSLTSVAPLMGLAQLTSLNLSGCRALTDLTPLSGLTQLVSLDLSSNKLADLSVLSGLVQLISLKLNTCAKITDLAPLTELKQLTMLDLSNCWDLTDLSGISELKQLAELRMAATDLTSLTGLANLKKLVSLDLAECLKLTDVGALSKLTQLTSLVLGRCTKLTDISALSGLTRLTSLNLQECIRLTDVSALSKLTQLTSLDFTSWSSLADLSPLSGLRQLVSLNLSLCSSLTDLSPLSGLRQLVSLNLSLCSSLTDLSPLSGLSQLASLDLISCEGFRSLDPLSSCQQLAKLDLKDCLRLTSIEPVREIPTLSEVEGFHPDQTAELLTHTAVLRNDVAFIEKHAQGWLQQIQQMDEAAPEERERFATTLGEALSLMGESPHEETYETYLASRPEFSASPWKAWLSGTREVSGWELMRVRVERQELANANPGCIGGVCASLSGGDGRDEVSKDERQWALDWLGRMEQVWADRGSELLPVSAEVCVAHLRHGLDDALGRWLLRLTDESDPASMDLVHAALGEWQLERENPDAARNHAGAIETPERRDPLLAELAKHYVADEPQTAGDLLLTISSLPMRREIMELLCADTSFVADPLNVERLVVACGDSAEALSGLIGKLPPETDSSLLDELSTAVREGSRNFHSLHRSTLQRMLEDLLKEFRDDKNAEE